MMLYMSHYFLIFMIYSFIGWLMEVILTMVKTGKFVNRGFLIGPYCPIYGCGCFLITYFLRPYSENFIIVLILSIVICMILEYITSYLMEKLFKARWWDYSDQKLNINGRVCLETAVPFGIGALLIMYIIHPIILKIFSVFNDDLFVLIALLIFVVFIIDNIVSFKIISKFKNVGIKVRKDSTEEITKKIKEYLMEQSKLTKRLVKAFPNFRITINNFKFKKKELKQEFKEKEHKLAEEFKQKEKELKQLAKKQKKK